MSLTGDRLNNDIDMLFEMDADALDNYFDGLDDNTAEHLMNHQIVHVSKMIATAKNNNCVLDGSDTGTGKTYTTVAVCKQLNLTPFIICPKNVISNWINVCNVFDVKFKAIVNYESIKNCKWYGNKDLYELKNSKCPYIDFVNNDYVWKLPKDVVLVYDEVHRCKNKNSKNSKLLMSTKKLKNKKIMLSATVSDTIENFSVFGYMLDFYKDMKSSKSWIKDLLKRSKTTGMKCIYSEIFPRKGSRMLIEEIDDFSDSLILVETHSSDKFKKLNKYGKQLIKGKNNGLIETTRTLQKIEDIKIDIILEMVRDLIDTGFHVVVFMNYIDSIKKLQRKLNTENILIGEMDDKSRKKVIKRFQSNKINLLIVSRKIQEGVSFHDTKGDAPRSSVISPSYSSQDLIQTLGRVNRAGSKSRSVQKVVFIDNSFEKRMAKRISDKLKFNEDINGEDFKIVM